MEIKYELSLTLPTRVPTMTKRPSSSPLDPRKSPKQARSSATVEVILEAAARILESKGLAGYTTNAVAEKAGVSVGSLYQYFPGKDALTGSLIRRETAVLLREAEEAAGDASGENALKRMIAAAVAHQLRRPSLARVLDFEEARWPDAQDIRDVKERLMALLACVLARKDLPRQPDLGIAAADVLAMVRGMIDAAGERKEVDPVDLERRVRRAVFGYLGAV